VESTNLHSEELHDLCWAMIFLGDELRKSGIDRKRLIHWWNWKYTHIFKFQTRKKEAVSEV